MPTNRAFAFNMAVILGNNVFVYQGTGTGSVIAGAKSCTVSLKCGTVEKASATQQDFEEHIAGRKSWDVSMNHLVTQGSGINSTEGLLKVGNTYTLRMVVPGGTVFSGQAICTQYDITGSRGALATGQIKFKGTGSFAEPT